MHDSATPHVILLRSRPADAPDFLCFTTVGCVGMIGLNEAGVAVGINNLLGADGQIRGNVAFCCSEDAAG